LALRRWAIRVCFDTARRVPSLRLGGGYRGWLAVG
jgi:hypothetical protein